jgi:tRNA pseudouridine13 synthase
MTMELSQQWAAAALAPPRAYGAPLARGTLRAEPEDFVVEEQLGFSASGTGQHVLLKIRKRNANTQWIARELAKLCGCHPRDIGYAGLKDRRAVALQWFSVPRSRLSPDAWREVREAEFEVLEAAAHSRKLPRGALAGNRFVIRVRDVQVDSGIDSAAFEARVAQIARAGVPNYFGAQRFGRDGANLARIAEGLSRLRPSGQQRGRPPERGFVLSAARSLVFNAVLAARIADGTWNQIEIGDVANLDSKGSVFPVESLDDSLAARCAALDIHPTGPLWGRGVLTTRARPLEVETHVASEFPQPCELVAEAGMEQERRALRLAVRDLTYERNADSMVFGFRLTRGSFATAVLRELVDSEQQGDEPDEG